MSVQLDADILLEVFAINTAEIILDSQGSYFYGMRHRQRSLTIRPKSLTTLRNSSQVCSWWRGLILASPSLWGACLDFEQFRFASPLWAEEVYRRAGSSKLSVKADTDRDYLYSSTQLESLLATILQNDWVRIQSLNIEIGGRNPRKYEMAVKAIGALRSPAPSLVSLEVVFERSSYSEYATGVSSLASCDAPLLQDLKWTCFCSVAFFAAEMPYFSSLTHLRICEPAELANVLRVLSDMPRVEYLSAERFYAAEIISSYPEVHMPKLRHLKVFAALPQSVLLVDKVKRAPGCLVDLGIAIWHPQRLSSQFETLHSCSYTSYLEGYISSQTDTSLSISVGVSDSIIQLNPPRDSAMERGPQLLLISSSHAAFQGLMDVLSFLFPILSAQHAVRVSSIHLNIFFKTTKKLVRDSPSLLYFILSAFPKSLTRLAINVLTLKYLVRISPDAPDLLANLSTLEIISRNFWGKIDALYQFLNWRVKIGRPIVTLDMSQCNEWIFDRSDTSYWDTLSPMKLIYRDYQNKETKEYTCGGGSVDVDIASGVEVPTL